MKKHTVIADVQGKTVTLETGWMAKQAHGAVVVRCGDTMVLVTAVAAKSAREGQDFFPLTVNYQEKPTPEVRFPAASLKGKGVRPRTKL